MMMYSVVLVAALNILYVWSNPIPQPSNGMDHRHINYIDDRVITKRSVPYSALQMDNDIYVDSENEDVEDPYQQYMYKEDENSDDDDDDDDTNNDSEGSGSESGESGNDDDDDESGAESGESGEGDDDDEKDTKSSKRDQIAERTVGPNENECCVIQ